jgi:hypothetical protein
MGYNPGLEEILARIINPERAGQERNQLTRSIVLALRELAQQNEINQETRDLVAFIAMALKAIYQSIDVSVYAWEKRGYWLKADKYRLEWDWTDYFAKSLTKAIIADDWENIAIQLPQIAEKLKGVEVPKRHRLGKPWIGARDKFNAGS